MTLGTSLCASFPWTAMVLILTFISERVINYIASRYLSWRTWYTDIIVRPNLEIINNFYKDVEEKFNNYFSKSDPTILSQDEGILYLLEEIKNSKEDFEFNFIFIVRSFSPSRGAELTDCINYLEDIVVRGLEGNSSDDEFRMEKVREIHQNKQEFFRLLYKKLNKLNFSV